MSTTTHRFICKACGAESPAGIGYASHEIRPLPAPAAGCSNPHAAATPAPPVFGPGRPAAARAAWNTLTATQDAYDRAGGAWGAPEHLWARLVAARAVARMYWDHIDPADIIPADPFTAAAARVRAAAAGVSA